jgi:SHS2 domain-containing protein
MDTNQRPVFSIQDHSGDLKICSHGEDYLEAIANASRGLVSQIVPLESISEQEERAISVPGDDETEQVVAFLNELLFLVYSRHWLPARVRRLSRCSQTGCKTLEAILVGEPVDRMRHEFRYEIKAVTYNEFAVCHVPNGGITIQFVCDL